MRRSWRCVPVAIGVAVLTFAAIAAAPGAVAADRPAVIVDLGALDALDEATGPGWTPPLPSRRPPSALPRRPADVLPARIAAPASRPPPTIPSRLAPVAQIAPPPQVTTDPVLWQRPIPVTAGTGLVQQVGARNAAPAPVASDKLSGADIDVQATAHTISALPNGDEYRILFSGDRTALSDTSQRLLDTLADRMATQNDLRLSVLAYAGGTPDTASRARLLSLERGLAVRNYLFALGVRGSRVDVRALGNTSIEGPPERIDLLLLD